MYRKICIVLLILILSAFVAPIAAQDAVPASHALDTSRIAHIYQTWNNCGPATLTMGLSYFGFAVPDANAQRIAAQYLKPDREDQNVSPWQMVNFVNDTVGVTLNVNAITRAGGDVDLLKLLISHDFPVIIEKGYEPHDAAGNFLDWMGHYLLLVGFDDTAATFTTFDSFAGRGLQEPYDHITEFWQQFSNRFVVLYPTEREGELQTLMGDMWDERIAWQQAKTQAQEHAMVNVEDNWAWFNLAEAMTALGEYQNATIAYRQAFDSGQMPWRTLWYMHGAFEAFYQTGQYQTVLDLAAEVQNVTPYIEETDYYRGLVYAATNRPEDAVYRFNLVLTFNPNFTPAAEAKAAVESGTYQAPVPFTGG